MLSLALAVTLAAAAPAKSTGKKSKTSTSKTAPAAEPTPAPAPAPVADPTPPIAAPAPAPAPAPVTAPAAVAAVPPAPAEGEDPKAPSVGVVDFSSAPDLQLLASALAGYVANELQRLGAFRVTTTDQIRQLLSLERQAQLLGCPDDSCRGQSVLQLGFDYVVTGKLTRLGGEKGKTFTLELVLLDQKTGARLQSDVVQGSSESELMSKISPATVKLVNAPLKTRSGSLVLITSEAGAAVKVDDVIIGTTPVGQATIAGGPHYISVEKDGFVTWRKEVRVKPGGLTEETVRMVPSPDFISSYKSKHKTLRIAMWGTAVLAVAGVVTGVAMGLHAQSVYGNENNPNSFLGQRQFILNGIEVGDDGTNHRTLANQYKAEVEMSQLVAYLGVGLGAAFGLTAVVLRLISDDPGKYDVYQSADVRVSLLPAAGGAVLTGSF